MKRKAVLGIMLTLLFIGMLTLAFNIQPVRASGTIYIRADGSVGGTTDISSVDNITYYFTNNIYDEIVVLKDNIVVDGAGYTVQGIGSGNGIDLSYRNNVTLKNVEVTNFTYGIYLESSSNNTIVGNTASNNDYHGILLVSSSNNTITGNTASSNNDYGIYLDYSSNNTVTGNTASSNNYYGIHLSGSSNNTVTGNTVSNNGNGIYLSGSSNNTVTGNTVSNNYYGLSLGSSSNNTVTGNTVSNNYYGITLGSSSNNTATGNTVSNNYYGISLYASSNNAIFHNNFMNNTQQVYIFLHSYANFWDDGYPSGGNYWSDYEEKYPNATEIDGSGIWDTPYVIDENNQDNYPIIPEFPSFLILPLFMVATLLSAMIFKRKHRANLRVPA